MSPCLSFVLLLLLTVDLPPVSAKNTFNYNISPEMPANHGFTCPLGGDWYACSTGSKFVGCCVTNPCATGCAQGNLRQAGFNETLYGKFPDASCDSASDFFTCTAGRSFWGCCKSLPCSDEPTCPQGDLVPAFIGRPEQANYYAPSESSASASASASASTSPDHDSKSKGSGAIIGGAVGGVVFLAILIGVLVFFLCRRKKQKRAVDAPAATNTPMPEKRFSSTEHMVDAMSPPPTYAAADFYHTPAKNARSPYPQHAPYSPQHAPQQWAHNATEPQELPADITPINPVNTNRYSELPAAPSSSHQPRYAELSAVKTARCSIEETDEVRGLGLSSGNAETSADARAK